MAADNNLEMPELYTADTLEGMLTPQALQWFASDEPTVRKQRLDLLLCSLSVHQFDPLARPPTPEPASPLPPTPTPPHPPPATPQTAVWLCNHPDFTPNNPAQNHLKLKPSAADRKVLQGLTVNKRAAMLFARLRNRDINCAICVQQGKRHGEPEEGWCASVGMGSETVGHFLGCGKSSYEGMLDHLHAYFGED